MSDLFPTAGCKFYIGDAPLAAKLTDFIESDFSAVTWVEVDGWTNMGEFGDEGALITTDLINRKRTTKQKGTFNAGNMQNTFAVIAGDTGQTALIAASKVDNNYPFKIVMNDDPNDGANSAPGERKFVGLVMSARETAGDANTVRTLNANVEINSNIVTKAPVNHA